jgi:hypothetical protein
VTEQPLLSSLASKQSLLQLGKTTLPLVDAVFDVAPMQLQKHNGRLQ